MTTEKMTLAKLRPLLAGSQMAEDMRRMGLSIQTESLLVAVMNLPAEQKHAFMRFVGVLAATDEWAVERA